MAMLLRGLCCGINVVLAALGVELLTELFARLREGGGFFPVMPEPAGLGEVLRKIEAPVLSEVDLQTFNEDGVLLVRGLVPEDVASKELRSRISAHSGMPFLETKLNHKTWMYNGAVRAVLRDGPVGDILAQVMGKDLHIYLTEAPIWGMPGHTSPRPIVWHTDSRSKYDPLVSIWLMLTDGPAALEFIRGSHGRRDEIEKACATFGKSPSDKRNFKHHNETCINEYASILEKDLGMKGPALYRPELKPGDAFIFTGDTLHRGIQTTSPRVALSLRAKQGSSEQGSLSTYRSMFLHFQIYPRDQRSQEDWAGAGWALLPGLQDSTPWLPAGDLSAAALRLFGRS